MDEVSLILPIASIVRICILFLIGIPFVRWCSSFCSAFVKKHFSQHVAVLMSHVLFYGGLLFIGVTVLHEFGFNITALLGAAGIFGVAIGFASQTSISNIISGFFLLMERPFSIGDMIKNGEVIGIVESIDLLSIRLRTLDGKMIRLPNEMVLKQILVNLTYYPVKRVDCVLSTAYTVDPSYAINLMHDAIKSNTLFLSHPVPVVKLNKIAQPELSNETRLFFVVRVWVVKDEFTSAASVLVQQLKSSFDRDNIAITIAQVN